MRPVKGTALGSPRTFKIMFVLGILCVVANVLRIVVDPPSALGVISAAVLVVCGGYWTWRAGYMLEWWGPPEEVAVRDRDIAA